MYVNVVYNSLPTTEKHIEEIKEQQKEDRQLIAYCKHGCPAKYETTTHLLMSLQWLMVF